MFPITELLQIDCAVQNRLAISAPSREPFCSLQVAQLLDQGKTSLGHGSKCQLRISEGGTCCVTSGVIDVVRSCNLLLYVWCCINTFTIQAHATNALVGFLSMYINEHFQPKLSQMVYGKGAFQIPLQNALVISQHNWGGIEQHMNQTSAN